MMSGLHATMQAVILVYRDTWSTIRTLWALAAVAWLVTFVAALVETAFQFGATGFWAHTILLRFLLNCVQTALIIPYLVAGHRLILLGERTHAYRLSPAGPQFQRYFWLAAAIDLFASIYTYAAPPILMLAAGGAVSDMTLWALSLFGYAAYVALTVRVMALFSAFALDAAPAHLRQTLRGAGAYFARTLAVFVIALVPILVTWTLIAALVASDALAMNIVAAFIESVFRLVLSTLGVVVASHLFRTIANSGPTPA